jgi:hypothetical protein
VPQAFALAHADIRNSLLPAVVTDTSTGKVFHRPVGWH